MTGCLPHGSSLSMDLMSIKLVRKGGVSVLLSSRRVVRVVFSLDAVKLQVQPLPVRSVVPPGIRQDPVKGHDVAEGHLQSFVLGQFFVLAPLRDHFTQAIEGCVQALHPLPLSRIGSHPSPRGSLIFLWPPGVWF